MPTHTPGERAKRRSSGIIKIGPGRNAVPSTFAQGRARPGPRSGTAASRSGATRSPRLRGRVQR